MSFPRTHSPRPSGSREQEDLTSMIKAFRDSMEAKLDLHSQKLTALVANIPRTDEGFEDLSQRITVLKNHQKAFLPKQEKEIGSLLHRQREEEGDVKDIKTVVGEEKEELHQVEDCVLKDQEELRNVEKKVLKEEEELQKVEESMEKEKQELYQVEDFILQRDETVKKLGESNQSQQEPYTTATSGSDQRFRSQQPNIGNTLAQDLALIPNLDPEICRIAIKYPKLFETKLRPPPPRDFQYKIQLTDHTQIYSKPYKCNQEEQALIKDFINEKLEAGVLVPAPIDAWLHPIFPIRKTNANQSSTKIAVDLRRLNKVTGIPCIFIYMDDILIHTKTLHDHMSLLRRIMEKLNEHQFQMNYNKMQLLTTKINFLGYSIQANKISPDISKIQAIQNWELPTTTTQIRAFVNFSNHFRIFIPEIAKFTNPLNELLKNNNGKNIKIEHTQASIDGYKALKAAIIGLPTLQLYNPKLPTIIFTDASHMVVGGYICQPTFRNDKEVLVPIAFSSHKLTETQSRYAAMEKELLAIIVILEKFRYHCSNTVEIYTDHQSLASYLDKKTTPPPRIARFLDLIGSFSPKVYYLSGKKNFVADIITRYQTQNIKELVDEDKILGQTFTVKRNLKQQLLPRLEAIELENLNESQVHKIQTSLEQQQQHDLEDNDEELPLQSFKLMNDELFVIINNQLLKYLPRSEYNDICQTIHDKHHPSTRVTDYLCTLAYWHPDHLLIATNITRKCHYCQLNTSIREAIRPYRPLEPLKAFSRWGMDYSGPYFNTVQHRYILVAVEYVTGLTIAVPTLHKDADNAITLATLCDRNNIQHHITSAHHPRGNGRVEKVNHLLKKILKALTNDTMQDWDLKLYDALRIYNATPTIFNYTPLYLALGIEPHHNLNQLQKDLIENLQKELPPEVQSTEEHEENPNDEQQEEGREQQISREEQQDGRDLVHLRIYELEAIKKARKLHTNLKTRRNAVQNMLKEPYGIPAPFTKGQWVYRIRAKARKYESNLDGPYQVQEVLGKGAYKLRDITGREKGIYNQDQLKLAYSADNDPIQVFSSFNKEYDRVQQKLLDKIQSERDHQLNCLSVQHLHRQRRLLDISSCLEQISQ
ncbi:Reverse transcriptase (RNA-dependent DNA polymerase) family protein [Candida albicans]|uniref:Reverse transcriptase (RNA-dependent DNA polymerase) family protein n=1 Tax=Candida albicans TaxID=5476 RepID=A0A8H6F4L9_CANAX|nr:Reverse transcriptase (RNA-dependent DNA polymerase) family protein [Candida albicans]KAF6069785.1 Reverse transcriptase (RNA-dependent DNA polymerase) family protein [Candida albicans]